ncbi:MAG: SH3 domain-containing protein [Nitratireductor sp.]
MKPLRQTIALAGFFVLAAGAPGALATSGPGCYQVVNVESWDVLNLRSRASAKSAIVDMLRPGNHGIIAGEGACTPTSRPLPGRWCRVTHYDGDRTVTGWAKRRYLAPSDCP